MTRLQVDLQHVDAPHLAAAFDCEPGEMVALVGPSGSGKTSLLRAVAGLIRGRALSGHVRLGDETWFDSRQHVNLAPQHRRVGLVFQHYALFPHLSAVGNTLIGAAAAAAGPHVEQAARALLQRLGLSAETVTRLPGQLSGGQQQRVALARALMRVTPQPGTTASPQHHGVLLLDEPFSAVDAPTRLSLYRELASLRQELSTPMVLVTHELSEARKLADRVVILDAGVSLQTGTPHKVFSSPRNARVAELVGIQNHFKGRFHRLGEGHGRLDWLDACGAAAIGLQVLDKNRLVDGIDVTWVLVGESVDITFGDAGEAPPQTDRSANCVPCRLREVLALGETSLCTLAPELLPDQGLTLNLSTAMLRGAGAVTGSKVVVWIPAEGIHIMPVRQLQAGAAGGLKSRAAQAM